MSIKQDIALLSGNSSSIGKIIRCSGILKKIIGHKQIDAKDIQYAVCILFSEQKQTKAINDATTNIMNISQTKPGNFLKIKSKIKNLALSYGITRITDVAIIYLDAIYENILDYENEDFEYTYNYDITYIIPRCSFIAQYLGHSLIRDSHFDILCNILTPNAPIILNWNIPKSRNVVENELEKYNGFQSVTNNFYQKIIYY